MKDLYKKLLYLLRNERYYTILNEGKQQQHDAEKFGHKFAVVVTVCLGWTLKGPHFFFDPIIRNPA